jgi:hypothetical protein
MIVIKMRFFFYIIYINKEPENRPTVDEILSRETNKEKLLLLENEIMFLKNEIDELKKTILKKK